MEKRILTLHPKGKKGKNILQRRYDVVKKTILSVLEQNGGELSYHDVNKEAQKKLDGFFDGKVPWYVVSVKLDLEARGMIERIPADGSDRIKINLEDN